MPDHPGEFRLLVAGSRTWMDAARFAFALGEATGEAMKAGHPMSEIVIIHGACPKGADAMAERLARDYRLRTEPHPADWDTHGKRAGFIRNEAMVSLGADLALAFIMPCLLPSCRDRKPHGTHGASHCARLAERAGITVRRVTGDQGS